MTAVVTGPGDLPKPQPGRDETRQAAKDILSGREFRRPPRSPVQVVTQWIDRLITRVLSASAGGTWLGLLIAGVVVAVVVVLIVRFTRNVQRDPGVGVAVHDAVGRPAVDWRAEAAAHEAAGRWRYALRCRYRALVADLAGRGLVDEVPGRTTGEYRAQVNGSVPAVAADFSTASDLFERAWYGAAETGPDDAERIRQLTDRVLTGASR